MGKLTMKLVLTALAVAVVGVSFAVSTGTASADGPRGGNDGKGCWFGGGGDSRYGGGNYGCNDNDDRHDRDRDNYDRHDKYDKHDYVKYDDCNRCKWDNDYDHKRYDYNYNVYNVRVQVVYALVFATPVPVGYVDFTPYSQGMALLVQRSALVIGVDTSTIFFRLQNGESLLVIANSYGIGEAALIEGLIFYNPNLRPFTNTIIHQGWLLTSNMYIPL